MVLALLLFLLLLLLLLEERWCVLHMSLQIFFPFIAVSFLLLRGCSQACLASIVFMASMVAELQIQISERS